MIIAISGVPGTGKTAVGKLVAKKMKGNLIEIKKLIDRGHVKHTKDNKRKTRVVDVRELQEAVNKKLKENKLNIIEGHLSHLMEADIIVILRTNPTTLRNRLKRRRWSELKIKENVEAELVDEITIEALEKQKNKTIIEIDTSKTRPATTARTIEKVLNNLSLQKKYGAGQIDWSDKYKNELMK